MNTRIAAMLCAATLAGVAGAASAQDVVKIGQIEAQTGTFATYGWMGHPGVNMGDQRNKPRWRLQGGGQDLQAAIDLAGHARQSPGSADPAQADGRTGQRAIRIRPIPD